MDQAFGFIVHELNNFLKLRFQLNDDPVVFGRLKNPDGSILEERTNKLVLSIVNLSLENDPRQFQPRVGFAGGIKQTENLISHVNINALLSANFEDDLEGLKFLSAAIQHFQKHPLWDKSTNPNLT